MPAPFRRYNPGDPSIDAADFNRRADVLDRMAAAEELRVPTRPARSGGGAANQRMKVKSIADDWLVCRTWDGTTEGDTDIKVAKPYLLQRTPWDGESVTMRGTTVYFTYSDAQTRDADTTDPESSDSSSSSSSGGTPTNATQYIMPPYFVGDEIEAAPAPTGGSGVFEGAIESSSSSSSDEGTQLEWVDTNRAARKWVEVCE